MTKTKKNLRFVLFLSVIFLSSCFNEKKIAYFQKAPGQPDTLATTSVYVPRIQNGDILSIYVSSLSPEASSFFNPFTGSASSSISVSNNNSASQGTSTAPALTQSSSPGFLVDASGNIELPLIGTLKVAGLTTLEAKDAIKIKLQVYLKEPSVTVRFLNYKISILGEVARPSVYVIPNETITLPEALSIAGDLTIFARRDNVQIIRDVNGKKEFGIINLNSREIFTSPYYYLHANDVIYVQPGKKKVEATDHTYQILPTIVSLISVVVILLKK